MNLKKLYTKCEVHSNPLLLFRQFDFFHTLCVLFVLSDSRGGTRQISGYRWAAEGLKPWPCLGQKIPKIHTLFRTTPSILVPCLGQLPQLLLEQTSTNHAHCFGQTCAKLYTLFRTRAKLYTLFRTERTQLFRFCKTRSVQ